MLQGSVELQGSLTISFFLSQSWKGACWTAVFVIIVNVCTAVVVVIAVIVIVVAAVVTVVFAVVVTSLFLKEVRRWC